MGDAESLLRRTCVTIILVGAVVALGLWAYVSTAAAVAFLAGVVTGGLMLAGGILVVQRTIRPPGERPSRRWPYVVIAVGKFAVAAAVIYGISRWSVQRLPLFALGYGTPIAVIFLKSIGQDLNRRVGAGSAGANPGPPHEG